MILKRNRQLATKFYQHMQSISPGDGLLLLWALRVVVRLGAINASMSVERARLAKRYFSDPRMLDFLGLDSYLFDTEGEDEDEEKTLLDHEQRLALLKALRFNLSQLERYIPELTPLPRMLAANIAKIAQRVDLNEVESRLLEFAVMLKGSAELQATLKLLGKVGDRRTFNVLAGILGFPYQDICNAVCKTGVLAQTGLLQVEIVRRYSWPQRFILRPDSYTERMASGTLTKADKAVPAASWRHD